MGLFSRLLRRSAGADDTWIDTAAASAARTVRDSMRQQLRESRRSLETAETTPWTNSWSTTHGDLNDLLSRQLPTLRARSRSLADNDEWGARYMLQLEDNVLGEHGVALQMRARTAGGEFDDVANNAVEDFWRRWGDDCEVSGLCWREVEALALSSEERDGELLFRLRPGAGRFGFQVQLLDPTLLDVSLRREWNGRRVREGVEIDDDARPVAYWLRMAKSGDAPGNDVISVGRHVRIPAAEIRHRFVRLQIGQRRGVPGLSVGARRLWLLHDFEEAAAVASSNAAKRQGFFYSPDGNAPSGMADTIVSDVLAAAQQQGKTLSAEEITALQAAAAKYATTVPGQFDTLPTGYDFKPFESKWPEISAEGYIKQQIRGWSAARGVSYHTLGNDLESVNYSSAQVGIGDERQHFRLRQRRLISWLHAEVIGHVLKRAPLYQPGVRASRFDELLAAVEWRPRTWPAIDVLKQAEADDIALRNRSRTRRQIWLAAGLDPDDMERELLEEEATFGRLDDKARDGSAASARHDSAEAAAIAARQAGRARLSAI